MSERALEPLLFAAAVLLAGVAAVVWGGAQAAALLFGCHRLLPAGGQLVVAALVRLLVHPGRPANAWAPSGSCLPGAPAYWAATLVVAGCAVAFAAAVVWTVAGVGQLGSGSGSGSGSAGTGGVGLARRRRLGVDPEGRFARGLDLLPIWVARPEQARAAGRIVLGWVGPRRPFAITLDRIGSEPVSPPASAPSSRSASRRVPAMVGSALATGLVGGLVWLARWGGGRLVATEDPRGQLDAAVPRLLRSVAARRRGGRGSVIVLGPSQCGKTSALAIPAILEWTGPVIALSVKNDLLAATIERRRRLGQVRVFDPAQVTGRPGDTWSPLRQASTLAGARQAARSIANATPWTLQAGDLGFWVDAGEDLLACLLWVAAKAGLGIAAPVTWILTMDRQSVRKLLLPFTQHTDPAVAGEGQQVLTALDGVWKLDPKQASSVYLTARQMIRPWQEPSVQSSATGRDSIDLDWLLTPHQPDQPPPQLAHAPDPTMGPTSGTGTAGGTADTDVGAAANSPANTVFLCADLDEAERLAPVLGGLLDDLLRQAYTRAGQDGPLDPPLLIVIDEAGNWPIRSLPARISTCAGLGIQLMLIYQSKAQIDASYKDRADIVLANATTKIAFSGLSDESSLRYASYLLGDEHVPSTSTSSDRSGLLEPGRHSVSRQPVRVELLAPSLLRQVRPGQALLVHHTLRPAHLHGRYWYLEPDLYELATGRRCTRRDLARTARQPRPPAPGPAPPAGRHPAGRLPPVGSTTRRPAPHQEALPGDWPTPPPPAPEPSASAGPAWSAEAGVGLGVDIGNGGPSTPDTHPQNGPAAPESPRKGPGNGGAQSSAGQWGRRPRRESP